MQFTVRRMMVAVAIVGIFLASLLWLAANGFLPGELKQRRESRLARLQLLIQLEAECRALRPSDGPIATGLLNNGDALTVTQALSEVTELRLCYEYAVSHPWLPIPRKAHQ